MANVGDATMQLAENCCGEDEAEVSIMINETHSRLEDLRRAVETAKGVKVLVYSWSRTSIQVESPQLINVKHSFK